MCKLIQTYVNQRYYTTEMDAQGKGNVMAFDFFSSNQAVVLLAACAVLTSTAVRTGTSREQSQNSLPSQLTLKHKCMVVVGIWNGVKGVYRRIRISKMLLQSLIKQMGPFVSVPSLDCVSTAIMGLGHSVVLSREVNHVSRGIPLGNRIH